jgi:glycosyltransferase involved in cell wall biosynthesis
MAKSVNAPNIFGYRVLWDGYGLEKKGSGIFRHAECLYHELAAMEVLPEVIYPQPEAEPLFSTPNYPAEFPLQSSLPFFKRIIRTKLVWPYFVDSYLRDTLAAGASHKVIYHGLSNFNIPLTFPGRDSLKIKKVLTVHDLIPFIDKGGVSKSYYYQMKLILPRALEAAERIICVSEWTKNVLCDFYPFAAGKATVISNGFSAQMRKEAFSRVKTPKENITLLYVSRDEKYKRIDHIIELIQQSKRGLRLNLVTCHQGKLRVEAHYPDLIDKGRVSVYTNLRQQELESLFMDSDVYVQASLYEGFGLPLVEALTWGLPVVCQAGSAVDEVVEGGLGMLMTRDSNQKQWIEAIVAAYEASCNDSYLNDLQRKLAKKPSWRDAAEKLQKVYQSLV